ncbi:MAG: alpha/beta hydrolase-fold protein [Planctomycetota bacterium]
MRTQLLLTVITLATTSLLPAQDPPRNGDGRRGGRREQAPAELKNFTFKEEKFHSDAVGQDMPFGIYLPKGYDDEANKDKKWPLIIWLHGMFEDHMRFHTRGGAAVLDKTVGDGKLPPCVLVTANGGRTSMYVNRKDERWEDLITEDLLNHLTKNYRVSEQRDQRAIMGVSLGGMAALRIALTKPQLFGAVGAHSSAVFAEDPEQLPKNMLGMVSRLGLDDVFGNPIQKEPWQKANPLCIATALDPKSLNGLRIYFDAGTDDRYGFAVGNKLLDEALTKKGIEHTWRLIEGGGHSWGAGFQNQTLPYSFAVVGDLFLGKSGAGDGKGDKDAKKSADAKH